MSESKDILHIAQDEKFINAANALFEEAFPGKNRFLIVKPAADPPVRYLNQDLDAQFIVRNDQTAGQILEMTRRFKVIVFHGLDALKGRVFLDSDEKEKFMGNIYGAEVYNAEIAGTDFLGDKSRKLKIRLEKKDWVERLKNVYRKFRYKNIERYDNVDITDVLYKLHVFGGSPGYSLQHHIDKKLYNPDLKKITFSYYPLDFIIKDSELRSTGNNILLGNSASFTNNHLEAIDYLQGRLTEDMSVYCPLSYGSNMYADEIERYGVSVLKEKFKPLREFMPLEEYNRILSSCGFVIMNHYRSQAMGNIIASVYLGAKVFLHDTDAYRYFSNLGCHVYRINEDLINHEEPFIRLSDEKVAHNRAILESRLSMQNLSDELRQGFREHFNYVYTN